jgi:hypothetical protein
MGHVLLVAVVHAADELLEEVPRLVFTEVASIPDTLKELATWGILQHNA